MGTLYMGVRYTTADLTKGCHLLHVT